ncbi:MAG: hypothetical protein GY737_02165, partial [Desulfobacteraceae bacterium]|nr:hypothetical protein [Desulfobacteraceae bacterium]
DDILVWNDQLQQDGEVFDYDSIADFLENLRRLIRESLPEALQWRCIRNIPIILPGKPRDTIFREVKQPRLSLTESHGFIENFSFVERDAHTIQWTYIERPEVMRVQKCDIFIMMAAYKSAFTKDDSDHRVEIDQTLEKEQKVMRERYPVQNPVVSPRLTPRSSHQQVVQQSPAPIQQQQLQQPHQMTLQQMMQEHEQRALQIQQLQQ